MFRSIKPRLWSNLLNQTLSIVEFDIVICFDYVLDSTIDWCVLFFKLTTFPTITWCQCSCIKIIFIKVLANFSFSKRLLIRILIQFFFFLSSLGLGLSLVFHISNPTILCFDTFFSHSKTCRPSSKIGLIPSKHYTLPKTTYCIGIKF